MKNYCQFRTVTFGGVEEDFLPPFSSILFGILLRRVIKDVIGLHYERERDPKQPPIKMCFSLPPKEKDKEKLSVLASFRKKEEKSCSFPIWGEKATAGKFIAALSAPLGITFFFFFSDLALDSFSLLFPERGIKRINVMKKLP